MVMDIASSQNYLEKLQDIYPDKDYESLRLNQPDAFNYEVRRLLTGPSLFKLVDKKLCKPGIDNDIYERNCLKIIKETMKNDFSGSVPNHHPQNLNRGKGSKVRDITLEITNHDPHSRWGKIITDHFIRGSGSIVFECKNYSKEPQIPKTHIYQLYQYLNPYEFGKLGIILSRYGRSQLSLGAQEVISRLKLDGYRILIFGDKEMGEWIDEYGKTGRSEGFFHSQVGKSRSYFK